LKRGFDSFNRGFGSFNRGFGSFNSCFGSLKRGFGSLKRGFDVLNRGFGSLNRGFGSFNRGFGSLNRGFGSLNSGFASIPRKYILTTRMAQSRKRDALATLTLDENFNLPGNSKNVIVNGCASTIPLSSPDTIVCDGSGNSWNTRRLSFENDLFTIAENDFGNIESNICFVLNEWTNHDFSSLLKTEQQSRRRSRGLPSYVCKIIRKIVYPTALIQNFDAKDNLYGRPDVIERVAVSAGFGDKRATQDLIEIFELYTTDGNDLFDQTAQYLQVYLDEIEWDVDSDCVTTISGFEEYQQAQDQTTFEDAFALYNESLVKGYARSAFELAKMYFNTSDIPTGVSYLKRAFTGGMLTATDMLLPYLTDTSEQIEYLKRRGEAGDPYGYYELA